MAERMNLAQSVIFFCEYRFEFISNFLSFLSPSLSQTDRQMDERPLPSFKEIIASQTRGMLFYLFSNAADGYHI